MTNVTHCYMDHVEQLALPYSYKDSYSPRYAFVWAVIQDDGKLMGQMKSPPESARLSMDFRIFWVLMKKMVTDNGD